MNLLLIGKVRKKLDRSSTDMIILEQRFSNSIMLQNHLEGLLTTMDCWALPEFLIQDFWSGGLIMYT